MNIEHSLIVRQGTGWTDFVIYAKERKKIANICISRLHLLYIYDGIILRDKRSKWFTDVVGLIFIYIQKKIQAPSVFCYHHNPPESTFFFNFRMFCVVCLCVCVCVFPCPLHSSFVRAFYFSICLLFLVVTISIRLRHCLTNMLTID